MQLPLLLHLGEEEGCQKTYHLPPGGGWQPLIDLEQMQERVRAFYADLVSQDLIVANACETLWDEFPTVSAGD